MKNYILIISILTTIVIFLVIYFGDYIKGIYFNNGIDDFRDVISIISNATYENFENDDSDVKTTYEKLLEARRTDYFEKNSPLTITRQEESLNLQTENYNNDIYDKYSTITDPVGDQYLPYTIKNYTDDPAAISRNNINEYTIINVYKNTLERQPTDIELSKNLQDFYENDLDEELLKLRIYNSTEYKIITNMQSNDINPELITTISKGHLGDKLKKLYKDQHNTELVNKKLLDILIKCYIHLLFNDYLFKALLMHDKYTAFETRLRAEYIVSDKKVLEIFNQTFLLSELRLIANELKRQDILKRKALQIPIALYNNNQSELNSSNVVMGTDKHITDIVRNSDNVFNINIMMNDKDTKTSMPFTRQRQRKRPSRQQQQQPNTILNDHNNHNNQNNQNIQNLLNSINNNNNDAISTIVNNAAVIGNVNTIATLGGTGTTSGTTFDKSYKDYKDNYNSQYDDVQYEDNGYDNTQYEDTEFPQRIYDPIDYKYHYRGETAHRQNVCSYGTKQIVQPVFLNSSTLFRGTDLKEAAENTQVGSIMPKFEYYEYEDVV